MATVMTAFRRPASIAYLPNQSLSFYSMDRSYRSNRPPQHPSSNHHILHSPPHSHHPPFGPQQHRPTMTTASFRHTSPTISSYPLVYSPSENPFNTPSLSADIQHEYPFELGLAGHPSMSFAEFDLSQSAFLNPGQLPWSDSKSELKSESSPASQPVFYEGSYSFYNDNGNPAIDSELFTSQPQPHPHPQPQHSSAPQVLYFTPSAESEMEMEGDLVHSSPSPHTLPPTVAAPYEVMSPSPPAFAPVSFPRVPGSSSPPGLMGESDEDLGSESGESEAIYPSDGVDGDDDGDFMPNRAMSRSRTRSRRTSSVSVSSGSGIVRAPRPCRLSAPVPVPNLTKKSRGRRVPTAPVMIVQGGVQKNMRMYRCTVEGCHKCFARGEHLKRHVRSIHTNEKREYSFPPRPWLVLDFPFQRTSVPSRDAGRISAVTTISGSICAYTRVKPCPTCSVMLKIEQCTFFFFENFVILRCLFFLYFTQLQPL